MGRFRANGLPHLAAPSVRFGLLAFEPLSVRRMAAERRQL